MSEMPKATIGRVVHVLVNPHDNNGSDVAPALVTRAWGDPYDHGFDQLGERQTVNVRVLLDQHDTLWLTSILLFEHRPTDEQLSDAFQHNPRGHSVVAFWPPRD